jgi:hypothetical protein
VKAETLLPYARVVTYDLKKNVDKCFGNAAEAQKWADANSKCYNLYRIEQVNGTWRTDWEEGK